MTMHTASIGLNPRTWALAGRIFASTVCKFGLTRAVYIASIVSITSDLDGKKNGIEFLAVSKVMWELRTTGGSGHGSRWVMEDCGRRIGRLRKACVGFWKFWRYSRRLLLAFSPKHRSAIWVSLLSHLWRFQCRLLGIHRWGRTSCAPFSWKLHLDFIRLRGRHRYIGIAYGITHQGQCHGWKISSGTFQRHLAKTASDERNIKRKLNSVCWKHVYRKPKMCNRHSGTPRPFQFSWI